MTWEHVKQALEIGWPFMVLFVLVGLAQASNYDKRS
jgi:hypothetical protein